MYAVIHGETGLEVSRHATVAEALAAIRTYESVDRAGGQYNEYDWTPVENEE